jgi:hypothetical protein
MRRLAIIASIWGFLAWLATTWVGSLLGFVFTWSAILLFGAIAAALGWPPDNSFPDPRLIIWGMVVALALLFAALAVAAQVRRDAARVKRWLAWLISLVGLVAVVMLSLRTMMGRWP